MNLKNMNDQYVCLDTRKQLDLNGDLNMKIITIENAKLFLIW